MDNDTQRVMNALRIAMYGSGGNFLEEVETLGKLLAEFDDVPYMADKNRLTQIVLAEYDGDREDGQNVEYLND